MKILNGYEAFIEKINQGIKSVGIAPTELAMMDHICYRVETLDRYYEILSDLGSAMLLGEAMISGRPIATIELEKPLEAGRWRIPYLELPAPKDGSPYSEGIEHVEFVVVGSLKNFEERHKGLPFDRSGMSKDLNPELGLKKDDFSVKFHGIPLGEVVRIERLIGRTIATIPSTYIKHGENVSEIGPESIKVKMNKLVEILIGLGSDNGFDVETIREVSALPFEEAFETAYSYLCQAGLNPDDALSELIDVDYK